MRGLSQRELARRCGLNLAQIYRYESEVTEPSASILGIIAHELDVTTDYLLGLSDTLQGYSLGSIALDKRQLLDAYSSGDSLTLLTLITERLHKLAKSPEDE